MGETDRTQLTRSTGLPAAATPDLGRTAFGIGTVGTREQTRSVSARDLLSGGPGVLTEFSAGDASTRVLVVPPLAGAYPVLLRDMVVGLLRHATVAVADWRDASCIPVECGRFGLPENVASVVEMIRSLGPGLHVVGVCQGAVSALAATALLCSHDDPAAPRSLTLVGGPVDPLIRPTRALYYARAHGAEWIDDNVMRLVPAGHPGQGRRIYPAATQMRTLGSYLARQPLFGEMFWKFWQDDGEDPVRFPFARLVTSLMDLPAELVLDTVRHVFIEPRLLRGELAVLGHAIRPADIRRTALMTIEAEADDITPLGQTSAAHGLCTGVPEPRRRQLVVSGIGHFSLFHGQVWRSRVLPELLAFISAADRIEPASASKRSRRHAGRPAVIQA